MNQLYPKPKALIVEDSTSLAAFYATALESAGYETEIMINGHEAQLWLAKTVPDFVLLDLHLPYVTGDKLLQQIREDSRMDETIVFLASSDPLQARMLQNEADIVLNKPISYSQLRDLSGRFRQIKE
ncbi:MAG: DNA-binding response regulator [Chloroflexi bacterium]|nr:MAG: DNA-binding response regulator [Chloroflexota bacterium]